MTQPKFPTPLPGDEKRVSDFVDHQNSKAFLMTYDIEKDDLFVNQELPEWMVISCIPKTLVFDISVILQEEIRCQSPLVFKG